MKNETSESIGQEIISRLKEIIRILDIEYAEKCGEEFVEVDDGGGFLEVGVVGE